PRKALRLFFPELPHAEVTAPTTQAIIAYDLFPLVAGRERCKVRVANRRAQLNCLNADLLERFQQAGEVAFFDHRPVGIGLTADRQSEGIGANLGASPGEG